MAILIKNPEVERKARELASLRGETITAVIDGALDRALAEEPQKRRRPTVDEIMEATHRFRQAVGLDKRKIDMSKAAFDKLNEIPGFEVED